MSKKLTSVILFFLMHIVFYLVKYITFLPYIKTIEYLYLDFICLYLVFSFFCLSWLTNPGYIKEVKNNNPINLEN